MYRPFAFAIAVTLIAAPVAAQRMSDSYEFLK